MPACGTGLCQSDSLSPGLPSTTCFYWLQFVLSAQSFSAPISFPFLSKKQNKNKQKNQKKTFLKIQTLASYIDDDNDDFSGVSLCQLSDFLPVSVPLLFPPLHPLNLLQTPQVPSSPTLQVFPPMGYVLMCIQIAFLLPGLWLV